MKTLFRMIGVAGLAVAALTVPTAAQAAVDPPVLGTVTDVDAAGKPVPFPIHRGESVPVTVGVHHYGAQPVNGVLLRIRVVDDLDLPKDFTNCRYFTDSNLDGAWCEFDTELAAGGTYAAWPFRVAATPDAQAGRVTSVIWNWQPRSTAPLGGDIDALAAAETGAGTPVAGTETALTLQARELPAPATPSSVGFAYPRLVTPSASPSVSPTASPSGSPAPTATGTAGAPATTPPPGGAGGGELPITGANTAVLAGIGALLVIGGAAGFLIARRRTRFVS
ncbi:MULTISPECIES: LPXTG cell wall anchor domain-containing protein [Catenuloplanes]|uniref:LPXTG-motif cell wall-anchored protein n=1 Tax=Catenuloplanes niger TaxID=587534 RepID=A0AAE3ZSV6_9ACTN|nr:LPXTG cell wall anchor domain-containing protein [Catenuloplanes niger]MDR7325459.1 LPXTG-motif cell wall-anchored protein [Catenuloplanes niger]